MKYPDLASLVQAVKDGELTGTLEIDNDATYVYAGDEKVFELDPAELLEQALDLLGVRHEGV
ncbi:MAG TPA: hypothetical protein VIZ43_08420 [Trebonia sp.]